MWGKKRPLNWNLRVSRGGTYKLSWEGADIMSLNCSWDTQVNRGSSIRMKLRSWHPVPSLHGKQMEKQCQNLFWGGSKITADGDCSHEIKRRLLLGRKVMTNLDSILKSKDITLPTKVCLVKAMVFPVVMYGCESWTVKKAEHQRIDAFELWCWRRLLREPLGLQGDPTNPF